MTYGDSELVQRHDTPENRQEEIKRQFDLVTALLNNAERTINNAKLEINELKRMLKRHEES